MNRHKQTTVGCGLGLGRPHMELSTVVLLFLVPQRE